MGIEHNHVTAVFGCFRCELSEDEVDRAIDSQLESAYMQQRQFHKTELGQVWIPLDESAFKAIAKLMLLDDEVPGSSTYSFVVEKLIEKYLS